MFNLVDVGTGKEGADHKVRGAFLVFNPPAGSDRYANQRCLEMLRIFMSNKHCKHIIFGGLHDNGYLNVLRPWVSST
jgi:hypothetical protein